MDKEQWRVIAEYPQYEASNLGRIRHIGGKPRKLRIARGYAYVCLRGQGKYKNVRVHRLVANTFIPNPHNKPCVNHKDGNKLNNDVKNLEWCTNSENELHKVHVLGIKQEPPHILKPVICVQTGIRYASIKDAWEKTNINHRHIGEVANGKRKTAGGYVWRFEQ